MAGLAALIEAERARLTDCLGATTFTIAAIDDDHCRVDAENLAIHFYRRPGDWLIDSSLEFPSLPEHPLPLNNHIHTWFMLKSRGEDWPSPRPAENPLVEEIARVGRAVPILRDEKSLVEALAWEAGYVSGYGQWDVSWA